MKNLLLLCFSVLITSCIQFRISEEEMHEAFEGREITPASEQIVIDSNHMHFVYINQGRDNLAIFIHGSPGSWNAFLDFFKNDSLLTSYDILSIDRPGYGYSDFGRPVASLERQAYLLKQVIARFDHSNKIMVGHSLGGPVAARIAMDYPELTHGMVLVAPSIDPDQEKYEWYRSFINTRIVGAMTPTEFWVSNEEIMPLKDELTRMLDLWKNVQIPTIVIQGTDDSFVPKENAEFAKKMLPDKIVEIRYLEGVNHFIPWNNPDKIVKALEDLAK